MCIRDRKYTFGTLLNKLRVPREPGRIPLAPVVFNIDMNMDDGVAFDGLVHRFESNPRAFENFELFLNATGKDDHLVLEWSYNTDLFDAATIRSWMDQFSDLVGQINRSSGSPIAELINKKFNLKTKLTNDANAAAMGNLLRTELKKLNSPYISIVRGMGLLNAIVIKHPNPDAAWELFLLLKENGLLAKPTHGDIIRFAPPLVINKQQIMECVGIIEKVISEF